MLTGLAAGAAHVFSGPDHLAALAPIAADDPARATRLGFRWGLGHGVGVGLLGALGIVTGSMLDIAWLSGWAEVLVGFVLVGVGLWALRRSHRMVVHSHHHAHDSGDDGLVSTQPHQHLHLHVNAEDHDAPSAHASHSHAAFSVGLLHGAAGTGHLFGVLPSLALPPAQAATYLIAYVVAAVGAMTGFGGVMGWFVKRQRPERLRSTMTAIASVAIAVGVVWIGQAWPS